MKPLDEWARDHGMIAVGSQLVLPPVREDHGYDLVPIDMSVPSRLPPEVDPTPIGIEAWMRTVWLAECERTRRQFEAEPK